MASPESPFSPITTGGESTKLNNEGMDLERGLCCFLTKLGCFLASKKGMDESKLRVC